MGCTGQCEGCAFKPGSAANGEIENHTKGFITAMAGNPFFCHESLHWQVEAKDAVVVRNTPQIMRAALLAITLEGHKPKVCSGWKRSVSELASRGWFKGEGARARRLVARHALRELTEVSSNGGFGKRTTSRRNRAMKSLGSCIAVLAEDLKKLRINPEMFGFL